ncbi:hypothetical protein C8R43DRAFT_902842, partial [Mycena crocata]
MNKTRKPARHAFHPSHPLFPSHSVSCDFTRLNSIIPNFIGAMPRSDKGDRSYYCITMLTMFKPWREPADLKDGVSTWSQAFNEHSFTKRELQLMENFNTRYECNDARDDHYSQMKKKLAEAAGSSKPRGPSKIMGFFDDLKVDDDDSDYGLNEEEGSEDESWGEEGRKYKLLLAEASEMKDILSASGW